MRLCHAQQQQPKKVGLFKLGPLTRQLTALVTALIIVTLGGVAIPAGTLADGNVDVVVRLKDIHSAFIPVS